jgi:hypothetical protein
MDADLKPEIAIRTHPEQLLGPVDPGAQLDVPGLSQV